MLVRFFTAAVALFLFATVGLFGQFAGLGLSVRLALVSTAVVIALLARLERPSRKMPGLDPRRATPLRRSAVWISWFTLIFMLAIRVPPGLVMVAALLPILGVHLNTSQGSLTPVARRTALLAPLLGHFGLMTAVMGAFGHAPWWAAALGLWLAGVIAIARLSLTAWVVAQSRASHHERVLTWLRSWAGGLVDHATQCHCLVLANELDHARHLQSRLQPYLSQSVRYAAAFAAVQAASGTDSRDAFAWITHRFPSQPHGPLGLSDTLLAAGEPAEDWAELAQDLARSSLWSRRLLPIADANQARAYAASQDPRALDVLAHTLQAHQDDDEANDAAVLHRLVLAAEACDHPETTRLRAQANESDPNGFIGQTIRTGALPAPIWP